MPGGGACILAPLASLLSWGGCVLSAGWPGWRYTQIRDNPGLCEGVEVEGAGDPGLQSSTHSPGPGRFPRGRSAGGAQDSREPEAVRPAGGRDCPACWCPQKARVPASVTLLRDQPSPSSSPSASQRVSWDQSCPTSPRPTLVGRRTRQDGAKPTVGLGQGLPTTRVWPTRSGPGWTRLEA